MFKLSDIVQAWNILKNLYKNKNSTETTTVSLFSAKRAWREKK